MVKRTLQEIANFFDMAVAVDEDGRTYMHKAVPYIQGGRGWLNDGMLFELPHYLVEDFSGDWRESLTLPDSWPFKEGAILLHKRSGCPVIWRTEHISSSSEYRRPTEAEWKILRGEE